MAKTLFTEENYSQGLLVDDELIGAIHTDERNPSLFQAFILRHTTGELLGSREGLTLAEAITTMNSVQRDWSFESTKKCQGCEKKESGSCDGMRCTIKKAQNTDCC
jgi:hypothetical protein